MSQPDRRPGPTPARTSDAVARPSTTGMVVEIPPMRRRGLSAGLAWRALRRHWWQAALLWLAGSAGLMALTSGRVGPTFEASSAIRVDPGDRGPSRDDFEVFKETQARRVTNPDVIASALSARPELLGLPRLVRSEDPEDEVRRSVVAAVVPGTNLIRVSVSGPSSPEAAEIANAVTDAYLKVAADPAEDGREPRRRRLREVRRERAEAVRRAREAVAGLVDRIGPVDGDRARDRDSAAIESYKVLSRQILRDDLDLVEAQAGLDRLLATPGGSAPVDPSTAADGVAAAFYADPEVAEVQARLAKARDRLAQAGRIARNPGDPSTVDAKHRVEELQSRVDALWARKGPALIQAGRASAARQADRRASEARVDGLKARLSGLNERLAGLNARTHAAGTDGLALEFARQDLGRAEAMLDGVSAALDQVDFEAEAPAARFRQEYRARASSTPRVDHRARVMAAIPSGTFLLVLGLFTLVELRAGRVVDPEEVPARLHLGVLGVVPPLPRSRPIAGQTPGRDRDRSRRDLDRFITSLDHLRVAICSGEDARGRPRRSVIVTSACGGEGKTTLAAQLAERCINAGLLTLLIDADLRNPSLSRTFELSEARGLVDVLGGEATAEEAIAVIGGAGGFHFLPAGSPLLDPARLLQDERLPRLLARARESFDLVIVDTPPVLPVPDALTIGRWVDGAVLAVRFDVSRYPLVDRANRRLAAVGVPVLGAVINGVRVGHGLPVLRPHGRSSRGFG